MQANPYAQYRQTQAQTASRVQLVVMLYEGIIRFCAAAEMAARAGDIQGRHTNLLKAQAIVAELTGSLNHEQGGEIATNLARLYDYCYRRLVEANVRQDPTIVAEVRGLIADLLPAWREAARVEQAPAPASQLTSLTV
jgi:flagellar protein FliS